MKQYSKDYSKAFEAIKNTKKPELSSDSRIFKPKLIDGKHLATFRFLDAPDSDIPWFSKKSHYWNRKEIMCPKTFGLPCPICEFNLPYNLNQDESKQGKTYIRALGTPMQSSFFINVAVITDKNVIENVGKNFVFKFGNPINDKLKEVMAAGFVPWDEEFGINFKLEVGIKDNQNNYSSSRFAENGNSESDDDKYVESAISKHFKDVKAIMDGRFPILSMVNKSELLSYDELKQLLADRISECDEFGHPKKESQKFEPKQNFVSNKTSKTIKDDDSAFDDDDDFPIKK